MPESVKQVPDDYQQRMDYASATIQYVGTASPSAKTSDSVWKIMRLTLDSSGRTTQIEWAGLAATYTQIWDQRADLVYTPPT